MADISVRGIGFSYGTEEVLRDLNIDIRSGEFVCVLGESGCGKSTFLRLMAGLAEPTCGEILIDGNPIHGAGLDRGVVFQDYSLFPWFSAGRNILISLQQKFKERPKAELKAKVMRGLKDVGLDETTYKKYPFELSGGQRQRCAICRAFLLDPPVLLMDEPFGALDAVTRGRLQRMILELWSKDEGARKTIIFVTHDVDEALLLATRIIVFGAGTGRVIYDYSFRTEKSQQERRFYDRAMLDLRNTLVQMLHSNDSFQNNLHNKEK